MKKIINRPEDFVKDTMEGIIAAYGDKVKLYNDDYRILLSSYPVKEGKVGIVTAGGSGHLPVILGFVGQGLSEMYLHRLLLPRWQTQFVLVIAVMEYWFSSEITAETK